MKHCDEIEDFFFENYSSFISFAQSFVLERAVAEDIIQDIFIDFIEKRDRSNLHTSLRAYFLTAIRNRCLNYLRDKKIHDKSEVLYLEALLNTNDNNLLSDESVIKTIQHAVNELPPEMRTVFNLRFFQSKKYIEIADIMSISKNTVKTHLSRGKQKLRESLQDLAKADLLNTLFIIFFNYMLVLLLLF